MFEVIHSHCAGIDIGAESVYVSIGSGKVEVFSTFTASYRSLVVYLQSHGIKSVAMEATGIYWFSLYEHLDAADIEVYLVNGAHVKNVPGRKSDVKDCQWLQQLHSCGLLRRSFIPDDLTRQLRTYTRLRDDHIEVAAMYINQMQKALTAMNIRLHQVISQIVGVSGLRIIDAILGGERDAQKLADLCTTQIKNTKRDLVIQSLEGHYKKEHLFALEQALKAYRFAVEQRQDCEGQIADLLNQVNKNLPPIDKDSHPSANKSKTPRHNTPDIDQLHFKLVTWAKGKDAAQISGLSDVSFLKLLAEVGTDMSKWPSAAHFVSWLGLSPKTDKSGKKKKNRHRKAKPRAGQIFRESAMSIAKSKHIALGGFYQRLKAKRGALIANMATARKLATQFYNLMRHGVEFVEKGIETYQQKYQQQQLQFIQRTAQKLGFKLVNLNEIELVH